MSSIRENVYAVGPRQSLVAAVAEPAASAAAKDAPAIVILNTGIIHRVGHQRKFVVLARALAMRGHTVARFDFSGIGDSDQRQDDMPPLEGCMDDIRVVLDWLASSRKITSFVLVGLCSGADHAITYAGTDPRVVGAVLLDPLVPPTRRYYLHYFSRRLMRPSSWRNFATGQGRLYSMIRKRLLRPRNDEAMETASPDDQRVHAFLHAVYARAVENNVQLLTVLTGATDGRQSYREQILDAFPDLPLGPLLRVEFLQDCDHLFLFECDRKRLNAIIVDWIEATRFNDDDVAPGGTVMSAIARSMSGALAFVGVPVP